METGSSESRSPNKRLACAACRHQRKKCSENCVTAPYFSAERTDEFQLVLKVFGVRKITRLLETLALEDRQLAADSFKWEASMRHQYPILGPLMHVRKLEDELQLLKNKVKELEQGWNNLRAQNHHQLSNGMIHRNYDGNYNDQNIPMYIPSISDIDGFAQAQNIGLVDVVASDQPNVYAEQDLIERKCLIDHHHNYSEREALIGSQSISYETFNSCNNGKLVEEQRNMDHQMISDPSFIERQQQRIEPLVWYFPTSNIQRNGQSQYAPIVLNNIFN